jgi:4-nitrophenyl phosphatase
MNHLPSMIRSLILDMDGVLWKGDEPIGDLPAIFERIRARGLSVAFATNNGTKTPEQYAARLVRFGVRAEPWQVLTSSLVVADLLCRRFPAGGPVFAIGEEGLEIALREKGFESLSADEAEKAQAVVIGFDRHITFKKMSQAALLVGRGLPFYATNPDKSFPAPCGMLPGAGAWISVIVTTTGIEPVYAGKPSPALVELARRRLGTAKEETLVVGDRLETDIAAGQAAGCPVAQVLSGVSSQEEGLLWKPGIAIVAADLTALIR